MTKRLLTLLSAGLFATTCANAQIIIRQGDMPVLGDQLTYSDCAPTGTLDLGNTGTNITWDYSWLTPTANSTDTFKTATAAGYTGIGAGAFGYKIADSLTPTGSPVTLTNVYTFFTLQKTPDTAFVASGFGAKLNGALGVSAPYSDVDEWYFLPMAYSKYDSSSFSLTATVLLVGSLKQVGWRKTSVDGWGTIKTPYFTNPVQVLRVRSEVNELDSIVAGTTKLAIPRHYVDYKWLANGEHYPALWITTNIVGTSEVPTTVRYRDRVVLGVPSISKSAQPLEVYPNPAAGADLHVRVPADWHNYNVHLFDVNGRLLRSIVNTNTIATADLAAGQYIVVAENNGDYRIAKFVR
jgi:hypothetical protein